MCEMKRGRVSPESVLGHHDENTAEPDVRAIRLDAIADLRDAMSRRGDFDPGSECYADVAHQAGMTKTERVQWYRVAERIPLSDRHAGHLLGRLKRRAA